MLSCKQVQSFKVYIRVVFVKILLYNPQYGIVLTETEFITLYFIIITVHSREIFILPSIFLSYKNTVKRKKKSKVCC